MQLETYKALSAQIKDVELHDAHVGGVLAALLLEMAHLHGLDPEAELAKEAEVAAREAAKEAEAIKAAERAAMTPVRGGSKHSIGKDHPHAR